MLLLPLVLTVNISLMHTAVTGIFYRYRYFRSLLLWAQTSMDGAEEPSLELAKLFVKTTQNSTGGTGAHSAGKLTKTEVNGKEDS